MKTKKELSVTEQMDLLYLYSGIAWIIGGIFMFFDGILFTIIEIIAMLTLVISHIFVMRAKKENQDELSEKNYHKARSHALTYMHVIYAVIIIALQLIGLFNRDASLTIDVKELLIPLFFISLGIEYIMIGFLFRKYERDGDECIY